MSDQNAMLAGILLLSLVTVESGGWLLVRLASRRSSLTPFQLSFFRAGHAHAAVLLVLSVAILSLIDAASLTGLAQYLARVGVPAAAILMPAGFFFSAVGKGRTRPSRFIWLLWLGVAVLTVSLITAGVGLLIGAATPS